MKKKNPKTECDECGELRVCNDFYCAQNGETQNLCKDCRKEHMESCICSECAYCNEQFKKGDTVVEDDCYNSVYLHENCVGEYHISQSETYEFN